MINAGRFLDCLDSLLTAVPAASALRRKSLVASFILLSLTLTGGALHAQEKADLTTLSVDDLMNVEVTTASGKAQKVADTAAAVFVITQDDIRRSGATSIPEVLRIVPGLDVARVNGNVWAISARGSNGQFANKLLVMIDGRSVYTPLFSGVYWDVQDTLLEDVDRIEVIRGPGGTLWGANAVNGVINIITKHAIETQGALVTAGGGTADGTSGAGRYGGSFGRNGYYRIYGKSTDRPASLGGLNASHDSSAMGRAGFRADWNSRGGDTFTAQGDLYRGTAATLGPFDPVHPANDRAALDHLSGEDLQFRWAANQSSRSNTELKFFYDQTTRSQPAFMLALRTFDADFQHHLKVGSRNDVVWGADYRTTLDRDADVGLLELVRTSNVDNIASAFVQDEIQVAPRFRVTIGSKLQYDPEWKVQLQPTLRFLFKASERHTIWAAATSAIRTPSEIERSVRLPLSTFPDGTASGGLVVLTGNSDLTPERVETYEAGYRWLIAPNVAFDATAFHNEMKKLIVAAASAPFVNASGQTIVPVDFSNSGRGSANGAELLFTDSVATNWNVALGYSFFQASPKRSDTTSPEHQLQLRSFIQLPRHFELDSSAYYTGQLGNNVKPFLRLDAQLSWHPTRQWEMSVSGQNLLHARHSEFVGINNESALATPVQRTVNGKITWRF